MSSYGDKTVKQLKGILQSRGLNCRGKCKAELIQQLVDDDCLTTNALFEDNDVESGDSEVDHEVTFPGSVTAIVPDQKSEVTRNLELELEIVKTKLKLQQLQVGAQNGDSSAVEEATFNIMSNVKTTLPLMTPTTDVVTFFASLERTLQINGVARERWAKLVPTVLSDKALKVYARLSIDECRNYDCIKSAIFDACKLNANVYLRQLQTANRIGTESYKDFSVRLRDLQCNYFDCRNIVDFESLKNDNLMVLFMSSLPPAVADFVRAKEPTNVEQCSRYADLCYAISTQAKVAKLGGQNGFKTPYDTRKNGWFNASSGTAGSDNAAGAMGGASGNVDSTMVQSAPKSAFQNGKSQITCYLCKSVGHRKAECPRQLQGQGHVKQTAGFVSTFSELHARPDCKYIVPVFVGDKQSPICSYRDSGAEISIAKSSVVDPTCYTGNTVQISGIGGKIEVQTANIMLWYPYFKCDRAVSVQVAVLQNLPYGADLLLGNDIFNVNRDICDIISVKNLSGCEQLVYDHNTIQRERSIACPFEVACAQDRTVLTVEEGQIGPVARPTLFNSLCDHLTTETQNQDTDGKPLTATGDGTRSTDGSDQQTTAAGHGRGSNLTEQQTQNEVCLNNYVSIIEHGTPAVSNETDEYACEQSGTAGQADRAKRETDVAGRTSAGEQRSVSDPVCGLKGQLMVSVHTSQSEPSNDVDTGQRDNSGKQIKPTGPITVDSLFQTAVKFQQTAVFNDQVKSELVSSTLKSNRPTESDHLGWMWTEQQDKLQLQRIDRQAVGESTERASLTQRTSSEDCLVDKSIKAVTQVGSTRTGGRLSETSRADNRDRRDGDLPTEGACSRRNGDKTPLGGMEVASVNCIHSFNQGGAIGDVFEATRNCNRNNYETMKDRESKQGSNGDRISESNVVVTREVEFAVIPCVWGNFKRPLVQTGIG
jgi:hypothetical protein